MSDNFYFSSKRREEDRVLAYRADSCRQMTDEMNEAKRLGWTITTSGGHQLLSRPDMDARQCYILYALWRSMLPAGWRGEQSASDAAYSAARGKLENFKQEWK